MDQDFFHSRVWTNWPMTWKVGQHINSAFFSVITYVPCFNPIEKIEEILHIETPSVDRISRHTLKRGGSTRNLVKIDYYQLFVTWNIFYFRKIVDRVFCNDLFKKWIINKIFKKTSIILYFAKYLFPT
jgi:hypothetical protein